MTFHRVLGMAVLALVMGGGVITDWTLGVRVAAAQDLQQRLYEDKEQFDKLSGAARSLFERRYGPPDKNWLKSQARPEPAAEETAPIAPPKPWEDRDFSSLEEPLTALGNTPVNNPAADTTARDTQSETTIVLGAGATVISGFNDSASSLVGSHFTGFSRSTDGGNSFTDRGVLPDSAAGDAGDPVLARDTTSGTIYFSTLFFDHSVSGLQVFRSFDNGASFTAPINGAPGFGGGDFLDKAWIAVDNFAGLGQGNVYLTFRDFPGNGTGSRPAGVYFTSSTDGGTTWTPSGALPIENGSAGPATQGAFVAVAPDHAVYVFWRQSGPARILVRKSTDRGQTFEPPVTVASLLGTGGNGDLGLEFRTNSFAQAVVNLVNGHLYVTFNDNPAGADRGDIFFTTSNDGGATWTPKVRVNDDATTRDQWQPALAVTPNGARVFMAWYDRRLDPANSQINTFGVIGNVDPGTGAVAFGPNFRISTQSFPAAFGQDPVVNSTYMGDYDQAVADNSFFYYTWGDNRLGNAFHAHQPDVRFTKIPVGGPGALLSIASTNLTGGNGNGIIDVNECNNLTVTLQNLGTGTATGVSGTLAFNSSGVTIAQAGSTYPNIPAGGTAANTTPFKISTALGFTCGDNIDLTLTGTTADGGVFALPLGLSTGGTGPATRFDNNTPLPIPDVSTVESTIAVSGITTAVRKVTVSFQINHTFDGDLDIFLVGPDGTTVELTTDNGGSGDNYGTACSPDGQRTTFDDAAATSITAGSAPFVGTFRPEGALAAFIGKTGTGVNGAWKLRITDDAGADIGTLNCWSLSISGSACANGGAECTQPIPVQPKLVNISTRGEVGTGDNVMIGGLIIGGTTPKNVLVRGRGPSLAGAPFFVPGVLGNPLLRVFSGPNLIGQNDNWQGATDCSFACGTPTQIIATGLDPCQPNPGQGTPPPGCALESAILMTLPPGGYTVQLSGAGGGTGVGLVEAFEVDGATTSATFHNISTRGVVGTGDQIMIGGVIVQGSSPKTILLRGRGPTLGGAPFFVPGVLSNPFLRIFSGATPIAQNNNWQDAPNCNPGFTCGGAAEIVATGLDPCQPNPGQGTPPPNCALESAILITLPPGGYTVQLSGASGETGVGLVEANEIPF